MCLIGGIMAIGFILLTPMTRNIFKLGYFQICRKIAGWWVEVDPIAILENRIREMKDKLAKVDKLIVDIQATLENMKEKLSEYKKDFDSNVRIVKTVSRELESEADQERRMALQGKLAIARNKVALLDQQKKSQAERITNTESNIKILKKLQAAAKTNVGVAESTVEIKKDEYEQAKKMRTVVRSIKSIFDGSWLTRPMEDQMALDKISETINSSIAEFNTLLDGSNENLIDTDINNIINADKVDEILKQLDNEANASRMLPNNAPKSSIAQYTVVDDREPEKVKVSATTTYF
jgi:phage shock protein A